MREREEYGVLELEAIAFGDDDVLTVSGEDHDTPSSPEDEE